jgi:predicted nuclease of predicted toxin-antitoxin system
VRFLVDAQLPPALARPLEAWGHVAEHVADLGIAAAPDHRVREYAAGVGAVIVTKDEDFAGLAPCCVMGPRSCGSGSATRGDSR